MRILRILTRLNLGGPARQVLASDPRLVARGHSLRVLAGTPEPGEGDLLESLRGKGIDVQRVRGLRRGLSPARDWLVERRLRRAIEEFAPDVVHTHASKAGLLGRRATFKARGAAKIARVHTFHGHVLEGYFPGPLSRRLQRLEQGLARRTDRIVAVSHSTADDLSRLGVASEEQLVVIPPGIQLEGLLSLPRGKESSCNGPLRSLIGAEVGAPLIGVVGRLADVKRPTLAVRVFSRLALRFPTAQLVFIGDGTERGSLERCIARLPEGERRRCHLLGAHPDPVAFLAELDLVLAVSRSEGLPVALIEAAAAGLPVVATDVGGVGELVAHERTGFLAQDEAELVFGLGQLLESADLRQAMGARARLRVSQRHSAERLSDKLEALYRVATELRSGEPSVRKG